MNQDTEELWWTILLFNLNQPLKLHYLISANSWADTLAQIVNLLATVDKHYFPLNKWQKHYLPWKKISLTSIIQQLTLLQPPHTAIHP